ncbi:MAG: YqaE/Pmp3 family membrane protein [Flavobacteriales bacterium]
MKKTYLFLFGILLIVGSCTIEKRHYTGGYHVEWNSKINKLSNATVQPQENLASNASEVEFTMAEEALQVAEKENNSSVETSQEEAVAGSSNELQPADLKVKAVKKSSKQTNAINRADVREAKQTIQQIAKPNMEDVNELNTNEVLLVILCIFIPFLAVFLFEGSITTNFWLDLLLCLLFWLPGIVFAFLVCFAGVSL